MDEPTVEERLGALEAVVEALMDIVVEHKLHQKDCEISWNRRAEWYVAEQKCTCIVAKAKELRG